RPPPLTHPHISHPTMCKHTHTHTHQSQTHTHTHQSQTHTSHKHTPSSLAGSLCVTLYTALSHPHTNASTHTSQNHTHPHTHQSQTHTSIHTSHTHTKKKKH